jgi:hypothetical protein
MKFTLNYSFEMFSLWTFVAISAAACIASVSLQETSPTPPTTAIKPGFMQQMQQVRSQWQAIPGQAQNFWQGLNKNAQSFGNQVAKTAVDRAKETKNSWTNFATDVKNAFAQKTT